MSSHKYMNILLINHYAGSKRHGMEYRPYYLAREWRKIGHRTTIVASSYSHIRREMPDVNGSHSDEEIDGIRYCWLSTPSYSGNGVRRVRNMISFVSGLYSSKGVLLDPKPDVIIASSTYPLDIYPAKTIARSSGAKLIYEVHDLWPLSPIELGGMSKYNPFIIVMQAAENYAYKNADAVVSMLPKASDHMESHGMSKGKFNYVPNGINADDWCVGEAGLPEEYHALIDRLRRSGDFIVGYAGAHGIANSLRCLVESADLLKDEGVSFICVGEGPEKKALRQLAVEIGIRNIYLLPVISREAIPALLDSMDVLYIGLQRRSLFRFGISPNKLMDYMMSGKPIIQAIEAGNDIVGEAKCGITARPDDATAVADAIRSLMAMSSEERALMGERGKSYVLAKHDYKVLARKFLDVMES